MRDGHPVGPIVIRDERGKVVRSSPPLNR